MRQKLLAGLLSLSLLLALLAGCAKTPTADPAPPSPSASPSASLPASADPAPSVSEPDTEPEVPAERTKVNFGALKGNTGMGAAWLMSAEDTRNEYTTTLAAANDEIVAKLTNGELDIAAMATNVAANLYNKTDGSIQMLAIVGLGLLYIAEWGETIRDVADLRGRTIYAFGQGANPEYVLNYLLRENGLEPGVDVTIEWKSAPDEVSALMLSGGADVCMLPAPAITGLLLKDDSLRIALDLTDEWSAVNPYSQLTQSCLVARTDFIEENPDAIRDFMWDYAISSDWVRDNIDEAAALIAELGIVPAAVAAAAIPQVKLTVIVGQEMQSTVQGFYEVLYAANPASIGGAIPDDAFYHMTIYYQYY